MLNKFVKNNTQDLQNIANTIRYLSMDIVLKAKSGHLGVPLGCAEIGTLLYFGGMRYNSENPFLENRDRFILSAGHGSAFLYSLLYLAGYNDVQKNDLEQFRQLGSKTPGHPEYLHTEGVEMTTGPLGQGLATAIGVALSERMLEARFNTDNYKRYDYNTWVLAGDGCFMEGVTSEACSLAGHLKLNKLIVFYDHNSITIDGKTDITFSENVAKRYEAYGWNVLYADGHSFSSLAEAMTKALENAKKEINVTGPTLIIAKTIPGKNAGKWEGTHKIHGNPMNAEDVEEAKKIMGFTDTTPFNISENVKNSIIKLKNLLNNKPNTFKPDNYYNEIVKGTNLTRQEFEISFFAQTKFNLQNLSTKMATRVAFGKAINYFAKLDMSIVGGSADLAGSNNTYLENSSYINSADFSGRNIHFGIREHGMGAISNGLALGGFRPYCATFLVFSDYMRASIRLAALMSLPTLFVLTHDSVAVGEDGPTHQPIEHVMSLRIIPNLRVLRPADALETEYCLEYALRKAKNEQNKYFIPTALILTRQDLMPLDIYSIIPRTTALIDTSFEEGAYILKDFELNCTNKVIIVSSGSELNIAIQVANKLKDNNIDTRVINVLDMIKLYKNKQYLETFINEKHKIISIEAGTTLGWGNITGRNGLHFGIDTFGTSAPADVVMNHYGLNIEKIVEKIITSTQQTRRRGHEMLELG